MTWTNYHDRPVCNWCGAQRAMLDLARVRRNTNDERDYDDQLYVLLCHGARDAVPTCYDRYQSLRANA